MISHRGGPSPYRTRETHPNIPRITFLDHVGIQRIVVPWVRTRLTTSTGGLGPSDYRTSAAVLDHLGLYGQARWVVDQALAHEDPQIQQAGHDIRQQLSTTPGNRTE